MNLEISYDNAHGSIERISNPPKSGTEIIVSFDNIDAQNIFIPETPFNLGIYPGNIIPLKCNCEIARCTEILPSGVGTYILTIERIYEGEYNRAMKSGDQILCNLTFDELDELESLMNPVLSAEKLYNPRMINEEYFDGSKNILIKHNVLADLQGGSAREYFHLTSAEHANLISSAPSFAGLTLTGLTAAQPVVTDGSKALASLAYTGATSFRKNLGLETSDSPTFSGLTVNGPFSLSSGTGCMITQTQTAAPTWTNCGIRFISNSATTAYQAQILIASNGLLFRNDYASATTLFDFRKSTDASVFKITTTSIEAAAAQILKLNSLTASLPVVSDANKNLVSLAYTGATSFRKNIGLETSDAPTFAGIILGSGSGYIRGAALEIPHLIKKTASANIRNSHDTEISDSGYSVYHKFKTITLTNGFVGQIRILFDAMSDEPTGSKAILTRNNTSATYDAGKVIGAEQSLSGSYATKSQDITQTFNPGDTVELWMHDTDGTNVLYCKNFRAAYDDSATVAVASSNS